METTLWTMAEQAMIKPISSNNELKFMQIQKEVTYNDLLLLLGRDFWNELMQSPSSYALLLNGGSYVDNGKSYYFRGLKYVCAYLLHASYVRSSYIQDSFGGMVEITGNDGFSRISKDELRNQADISKGIAGTAWDECKEYLRTIGKYTQPSSRRGRIQAL